MWEFSEVKVFISHVHDWPSWFDGAGADTLAVSPGGVALLGGLKFGIGAVELLNGALAAESIWENQLRHKSRG